MIKFVNDPQVTDRSTGEMVVLTRGKGRKKQEVVLGYVRQAAAKSGFWVVTKVGRWYDHLVDDRVLRSRPVFPTREAAAECLEWLHDAVEASPTAEPLREYLGERARQLDVERNRLMEALRAVDRERQSLSRLGRLGKVPLNLAAVDLKQEVADLVAFMDEYYEPMYKKLGKDFGRSLRARLAAVLRTVHASYGDLV